MPNYVFTYRKPLGYQPSPESAPAWMAWFDGMGERVVEIGQPVGGVATLGTCDPSTTELGGYSIVRADDLATARALAEGCPQLGRGGGVEVGELLEVPASVDNRVGA